MASELQRRPTHSSGGGPYVLRPLLQNVPLSADGGDEDIKINCVDYLGTIRPLSYTYAAISLTDSSSTQMATCTSARRPRSCFTFSRFLPIPVIRPEAHSLFSHPACVRRTGNLKLPVDPGLACNRSSCCRALPRHASSATGPSPSTRCPN